MQRYIGVILIKAIAMKLLDAEKQMRCQISYKVGIPDNDRDTNGYIVTLQEDSCPYDIWMTKEQFDKEYRPIDGMTFGLAIEALKQGKKVARAGWNGNGMYLEAQFPDERSKMTHLYLFMTIPECKEGTRRIPWQPAQVDLFGEDWSIVE